MDMMPLTVWNTVFYSILTLLIYLLLGYGVSSILQRLTSEDSHEPLPFRSYGCTLPTLLVLYLGLGLLSLIFLLTLSLFFPGAFLWKVIFIMGFSLLLFLFVLTKRIKDADMDVKKIMERNKRKWVLSLLPLVFMVYGIFHFINPALGFYAPPGIDDVPRAFYSNIIVETGKHPFLTFEYPFATPKYGWRFQTIPMLGAFFSFIYHTSITKTHLFFLQFNRGLTPLFIYALVDLLLKRRPPRVRKICGLCSMIGSTFSLAQYLTFSWGGVSESIGYSTTLVLLMGYLFLKSKTREKPLSFRKGRIIGEYFFFFLSSLVIMAYVSFRVLPLYVMGIFAFLLIEGIKRDKGWKIRGGAFLGVIASTYLISIIGSSLSNFPILDILNPFVHPQNIYGERLILTENGNLWLYCSRFVQYFHHFHGKVTLPLFILSLAGIGLHLKTKDDISLTYPFLVAILLFAFSQNNPHGLFYIPYPGVFRTHVFRLYPLSFIPLAMIQGIGLGLTSLSVFKIKKDGRGILQLMKSDAHELRNLLSRQEKHKLILFILFMSLLLPRSIQAGFDYQRGMYERVEGMHHVTSDDMKAFHWMTQHLPERERFLVSPHGTGKWIPMYTDHIVLPPKAMKLHANESISETFEELTAMLVEGNITSWVCQQLVEFKVGYVYVGLKHRPWRSGGVFDKNALKGSPRFNSTSKSGKVMAFGKVTIFRFTGK